MEKKKPKVVETIYAILVNGELSETYKTLRLARRGVKNLNLSKDISSVEVVKQTTSQTLIDTYKPEVSRVLVAGDFDWDGQS